MRLGRVVLHSTQPWPYPANLMIGAVAHAVPDGQDIHLGHDPELEHARWVPLPELRRALQRASTGFGEEDEKESSAPKQQQQQQQENDTTLRLPPKTAISNRLLTAVVEGFAEP